VKLNTIPGHKLPLQGFAITFTGHTALSGSPLDEWSALRRDLDLTAHNTCKKTDIHDPAIPASERPQTHALYSAATGLGNKNFSSTLKLHIVNIYKAEFIAFVQKAFYYCTESRYGNI
jgi:hypothetical protein